MPGRVFSLRAVGKNKHSNAPPRHRRRSPRVYIESHNIDLLRIVNAVVITNTVPFRAQRSPRVIGDKDAALREARISRIERDDLKYKLEEAERKLDEVSSNATFSRACLLTSIRHPPPPCLLVSVRPGPLGSLMGSL